VLLSLHCKPIGNEGGIVFSVIRLETGKFKRSEQDKALTPKNGYRLRDTEMRQRFSTKREDHLDEVEHIKEPQKLSSNPCNIDSGMAKPLVLYVHSVYVERLSSDGRNPLQHPR